MRLFVAFAFPPQIRDKVTKLLKEAQPLAENAKWIKHENLHVTLVFLGYVADDRVSEVERAITFSLSSSRPVLLSLVGGGSFGSKKKPRVLWLGLGGEIEAVKVIHASLERALVPFAYEPEKREYTPHLTLARARDASGDLYLARCLPLVEAANFGDFELKQIVLFRSDLSRKGPTYTAIREFPLGLGDPLSSQ